MSLNTIPKNTDIQSLSNVPFGYIQHQLYAKKPQKQPQQVVNSYEDFSKVRNLSGEPLSLSSTERTAIIFRTRKQHYDYPADYSDTHKKTIDKFKSIINIFYLNAYKNIKSRMLGILKDIFNFDSSISYSNVFNKDETIYYHNNTLREILFTCLIRFFYLIDLYIYDDNAKFIEPAKMRLAEAVNFIQSGLEGEKESNEKNYKLGLELLNLVGFMKDCVENRRILLPRILIPSSAYPPVPIERGRIILLYLNAADSITLGIDVLVSKLHETNDALCVSDKTNTNHPQKTSKIKQEQHKKRKLLQTTNKVKNFIDTSIAALLKLKSIALTLLNKESAELWSNILQETGYVTVVKNTPFLNKTDADLLKSITLLETKNEELKKISKVVKVLFDTMDEEGVVDALKSMENQLNLNVNYYQEIMRIFETVMVEQQGTFCPLMTSTLNHCKTWVIEKSKSLHSLNSYFIHLKTNHYTSPVVTPIDCMIHQCMGDILEIQKQISTTNSDSTQRLKLVFHFFLLTVTALNSIVTDINMTRINEDVTDDIKRYLTRSATDLLSLLQSHDDKNIIRQISIPLKRLYNFLDSLKDFITEFEKVQSTSMLYRALANMWGTNSQDVAVLEIDPLFVKQCFHYTSWCLKHLAIDDFNSLLSDTNLCFLNIISLYANDGYREILDQFDKFLDYCSLFMVEFYLEMQGFFVELKRWDSTAQTFLDEASGPQITEEQNQRWLEILVSLRGLLKTLLSSESHKLMTSTLKEVLKKDLRQDSPKHVIVFQSLQMLHDTAEKLNYLLDDQLAIPAMMIPRINDTLYKFLKVKNNIKEFEKSEVRNITAFQQAGFLEHSEESEEEIEEDKEIEIAPPTQILKQKPIDSSLLPITELKSRLKRLNSFLNKREPLQSSSEHVINALHYTSHILELLMQPPQNRKWDNVSLLTFLTKCTLLFEQTVKYWLTTEQSELLNSHDLIALWELYEQSNIDPSLVISIDDRNLLSQFSSMTQKNSRYPLAKVNSDLLIPFVNLMMRETDEVLAGKNQKSNNHPSVELQGQLLKAGNRLIDLSLNLWKREVNAIPRSSVELPVLNDQTNNGQNVKQVLHHQMGLVLKEIQRIKSFIDSAASNNEEFYLKEFKGFMVHVAGAFTLLNELINNVDAKAAPYSAADAMLLHSSTLLEQAALALISQLEITNPEIPEEHILSTTINNGIERPWKYSHNIREFLNKIEETGKAIKLSPSQILHVQEITEFLTSSNHYPANGKNSLSVILNDLRKCLDLKERCILLQHFFGGQDGKWCIQKFGKDHKTWVQQIDKITDYNMNSFVYTKTLQTLEIANTVLSNITD